MKTRQALDNGRAFFLVVWGHYGSILIYYSGYLLGALPYHFRTDVNEHAQTNCGSTTTRGSSVFTGGYLPICNK